MEFIEQPEDDPANGSASLRRAVVAETLAEIERLELSDAVDVSRPFKIGLCFAGLAMLGLIVVAIDTSSLLAVKRLLLPFGNDSWHRLAFVEPVHAYMP